MRFLILFLSGCSSALLTEAPPPYFNASIAPSPSVSPSASASPSSSASSSSSPSPSPSPSPLPSASPSVSAQPGAAEEAASEVIGLSISTGVFLFTSIILSIALCYTKKVLCCSVRDADDDEEGKEMLNAPLNARQGLTISRALPKRGGVLESTSADEPEEWQDESGFAELERGEQEAIYNNILTQQLGRIGISNKKGDGETASASSASGVTIN